MTKFSKFQVGDLVKFDAQNRRHIGLVVEVKDVPGAADFMYSAEIRWDSGKREILYSDMAGWKVIKIIERIIK